MFSPSGLPPLGNPAHTNIPYNLRPVACWPSSSKPTSNRNDRRYWVPCLGAEWQTCFSPRAVFAFPRLSKLKNKALISDLIVSRHDVRRTHKTGINVLYASGAAMFVPLKAFELPGSWRVIRDGEYLTDYNNFFLFESSSGTQSGVWVNIDRFLR
jgi:hypothetical protein